MKTPGYPSDDDFRIVVFPPMGYAYTTFIDHDIDAMQGVVGGLIEHLHTGIGEPSSPDREIDFWCNDEFTYAPDMVFNRVLTYRNGYTQPIYGQMFASACTMSDGESRGLEPSEALSILVTEHLAEPQLLFPNPLDRDQLLVQVVKGGCGAEFCESLRGLPAGKKELNCIPLTDADFDRLLPFPLVGKPEAIVAGRWLVKLVYPGDRYKDSKHKTRFYEGALAALGHNLPLVEFYDLSSDGESFPTGEFVTRCPMSTLMNLDRLDSAHEPGRDLESCTGIDLGKGKITGSDFLVARRFIERTYQACLDHGRSISGRQAASPREVAEKAIDAASSKHSEGESRTPGRSLS